MITVKVSSDNAFKHLLDPVKKHASYALADAINKTMEKIKKDQSQAIQKNTKIKANRYTLNSPRIKFASRKRAFKNKDARLYYTDYMAVLTNEGGGTVEPHKDSKRLYNPVKYKTKAGRQPSLGSKKISRGIAESQDSKSKFFVGVPKGKKYADKSSSSPYFGLWKRVGKGGLVSRGKNKGNARGKLQFLVQMNKKQRHQERLFDAEQLAVASFNKRFKRQLTASFGKALSRSSYKGKLPRFT